MGLSKENSKRDLAIVSAKLDQMNRELLIISPNDIPSECVQLMLVYDEHKASHEINEKTDPVRTRPPTRTRTMQEIIETDYTATIY